MGWRQSMWIIDKDRGGVIELVKSDEQRKEEKIWGLWKRTLLSCLGFDQVFSVINSTGEYLLNT